MPAIAFNMLNYVKQLEEAGFTRQQAEAQADILGQIIDDKVATKRDLKELETRLQKDLAEMELRRQKELSEMELRQQKELKRIELRMAEIDQRLQKNMSDMEIRLLKWQWGFALALAAIMAKGFGWLGF